jgi:hypothetical protein
MRKRIIIGFMASMLTIATASAALATPSPPTNAGNGAGQSGQCTGPAADRPAACQSH